MNEKNRKYATAVHPTIEAVVNGLYRYKDRKQALARLKALSEHFVLSKEQPKEVDTIRMWIKGFAVTEEEEKKGYTGNFADIGIVENEEKKFTLIAKPVAIDIDVHPQKKRVIMRHPNWGHPVFRSAKKGRIYETMEEAQADMMMLHEEFPEVSIPGINKLYIIVYGKLEGSKSAVHKMALEVQADKDGKGFQLLLRDNEKNNKKERKTHSRMGMDKPKEGPKGYFSSLEVIRKEKKKKKFGQRYKVKTDDAEATDKKD